MISILSLSAERKLAIVEQLHHKSTSFIPAPSSDLLSLSRVCKAFRTITLPYLFKEITLLNDKKSCSSVSSIINNSHAEHVRTMHYIGVMPMPPDSLIGSEEPIRRPSLDDLPESVEHVLSSLVRLPKLERLIVEFRYGITEAEDEEIYGSNYNIFDEQETHEEILEAEKTHAFRSLATRSYDAIARNPTGTIKDLEFRNIVAKECSAWKSPMFHDLLSGLSKFTISFRGGDNGAGWQINMVPAYLALIEDLDEIFFSHMPDLKQLRISATTDGPFGLADGMNNAALPLTEGNLKNLQHLELEHVFISTDLAAFITSHASSLNTVQLKHCYSGLDDNNCAPEVGISWGEFFTIIASGDLSTLRDFEVRESDLETRQPPKEGDYDYGEAEKTQELRTRYPGRRMFDYKHLDDKYGMLFSSELGFEMLEEGTDHASWERLCAALGRAAQTVS